jgi:hypothetical protein
MSANIVPLPYSRIAVQHAHFTLNEAEMRSFLRGKEAWFETDYVVFRRGDDCAVTEIRKADREDLFCAITDVRVISLPNASRWIDDSASIRAIRVR